MKRRLIFAIVSTVLEEVAIVIIVLWGLPQVGIQIPIWGLIIIMFVWALYSIYTFRKGTQALKRELMIGFPNMIGTEGEVVTPLAPEGMIRVKSELWIAKSEGDAIKPGQKVTVVDQKRLKLVVRETSNTDNREIIN